MKIYTPEELIAFEEDIADCFNKGMIKAPVHLYSGNEEQMINIFKDIRDEDWILCSWRSHYQCLLKGVPKDVLKEDILDGKSISLSYPEYNILSSAIVGGTLPIATGLGLSLKKQNKSAKVYCFVGEMTAETGTFFENMKYCYHHKLPVRFIIEDNNKSVCTDTRKVMGTKELTWESFYEYGSEETNIKGYKYESRYPHAGAGKRIQF